ncbi:S-layer homology domain-containing protein [Butyricicoccus sp. AM42-5AC]|nr:S-layer homology domain-containing protein [Butyricicoccus sp. AM42-5AC]
MVPGWHGLGQGEWRFRRHQPDHQHYPRAACHHAVSLRWFSGRKRFIGQLHGRKHRQQLCCQRDAVGAVENGIVNGSNGKLNPKNNATRAEVAAILMRFCEMGK